MEPQEKRDMREGRSPEEILYVVMCVIISVLIVAAVFPLLILPEKAALIRRVIFILGASLNVLVAVRFFTRRLRMRGWLFTMAAGICVALIFI